VANAARAASRLALDTEFVSERRYWSKLCVVAFAVETEGGVDVSVLDALAPHDPSPVLEVLADPSVEVVVHAGEQDVALLRRNWNASFSSVLDTQIAAAFAGSSIQSSYGRLVRELLDVSLSKSAGFTSWDRRPLTTRQISYVRKDVEHLPALARALEERLERQGRLGFAREESKRVETASDERDPERSFRQLQGVSDLSPAARAIARELVLWRDGVARAGDRLPKSVVLDVSLAQLARERPDSIGQLRQVRGIGDRIVSRHGKDILAAVERGKNASPIHFERGPEPPDEAEPLTSLAEALVRARAQSEEIAAQLIATRADIADVVIAHLLGHAEPPIPLLRGWRREMVGNELIELLRGERALSVADDGRLEVRPAG
jgi:ribonuclease D